MADRLLLIVDTYVSPLATAVNATGVTMTGIAWGGGAGAGALLHPAIPALTAILATNTLKRPATNAS